MPGGGIRKLVCRIRSQLLSPYSRSLGAECSTRRSLRSSLHQLWLASPVRQPYFLKNKVPCASHRKYRLGRGRADRLEAFLRYPDPDDPQAGSEIWVTFNPDLEEDDAYQRFVVWPQFEYTARTEARAKKIEQSR